MDYDDECSTTVELSSDDDNDLVVISDDDDGINTSNMMWCDWRQFKEFLMNEYLYAKIKSYRYFKDEKKCWRVIFI